MSSIKVACPCCGVSLKAESQLIGSTIRCPKCLSPVPIKREKNESDLAQPIEANYEAKPGEEELITERPCPMCSKILPAEVNLCTKCGYHLKLETFFDDLKEENLKPPPPQTKGERWFLHQLYDYSTPREVMLVSVVFMIFVSMFVAFICGINYGPYSFFFSFPVISVMWFAWFKLMQVFGVFKDPNREKRLQKELQQESSKKTSPPNSVADTKKPQEKKTTKSVAPPKAKIEKDVKKDPRPITEKGRAGEPSSKPAKESPKAKEQSDKNKALPSENDDQWLSDLL